MSTSFLEARFKCDRNLFGFSYDRNILIRKVFEEKSNTHNI